MDKVVKTLQKLGLFLAILSGTAVFEGCVHKPSVSETPIASELDSIHAPQNRREGVDAILILMPDEQNFRTTWSSLRDELVEDFDVFTYIVTDDTTVAEIDRKITEIEPNCLVLMNNKTAKLYELYQKSRPAQAKFPPAIFVMTSYLGQIYNRVKGATGIAYEIPEVTSITKLRTILERPIRRVGVIYRTPFRKYLQHQASLAKREKIETFSVDVGMNPKPIEVRKAITALQEHHKIDVLWVLNDSVLIAGRNMLQNGWLPAVDRNQIPVVVGVENLVNKNNHFGAFAMVPDHGGLGVQAANIIYEIYDNGWELDEREIEQPLSMKTIVDIELVRKKFQFKENMIGIIDVLVE